MSNKFSLKLSALALSLAAAIALTASSASAQWVQNSAPSSPKPQQSTSIERRNVIFANPFGILFGIYTVEFESKINESLSLAVSGSYWDKPTGIDLRYNSLNALVRFYPMERVFKGFSIGPSLGVVSFDEDQDDCVVTPSENCGRKKTTNASFGVQADYSWLLGPSQRFAVGTGLGARRIIGSTGGDTRLLPVGRFQIGYAF